MKKKFCCGRELMYDFGSSTSIDLPVLPFYQKMPHLSDGVLTCIKGQLWPNAKNVTIQLLHSPEDVVFLLEIVCEEDETLIARSCQTKGKLIKKEVDNFDKIPKPGEVFEIILLITPNTIKCSINGCHLFDFPLRSQSDSSAYCKISGHCDIARVSHQLPRSMNHANTIQKDESQQPTPAAAAVSVSQRSLNGNQYPLIVPVIRPSFPVEPFVPAPPPIGFLASFSPPGSLPAPSHQPFAEASDVTNVAAMVLGKLDFPNGIPVDLMINLYASTIPRARWFKVTFGTCAIPSRPGDFAFAVHVDLPSCRVIRNDSIGGVVGQPETVVPYFPFVVDQQFSVVFKCLRDKYMMAVNGQHFLEFVHRRMGPGDVSMCRSSGAKLSGSKRTHTSV